MKNSIYIILSLSFLNFAGYSQFEPCERMYIEARKQADSGHYELALNKLAAAKICNPGESRYDSLIVTIYQDINRQKEIAVSERKKTEAALAREKQAKQLETIAKKEAVTQKEIVQDQLARIYWGEAQTATDENNLVKSLLFSAQAVNTTKNEILKKSILLSMIQYMPQTQLKSKLWHPSAVKNAEFTSDSKVVLTVSGGAVYLWNASSGELITPVIKHKRYYIKNAVFSSDNKRIVTTIEGRYEDSTHGFYYPVCIWDAGTGNQIGNTMFHSKSVSSAIFSPDGNRVLTVSWDDSTARLWNANSGDASGIVMKHDSNIKKVVFSSDSRMILSTGLDWNASLWDAVTGEPIGLPMEHDGIIMDAAFSPKNDFVLTISSDNSVLLWKVSPSAVALRTKIKHEGRINYAVFNKDGSFILTAGDDNVARLWETQTGLPAGIDLKHDAGVKFAVFSPDDKYILTECDDEAHIWDANTGEHVNLAVKQKAGLFSPDGKYILSLKDGQSHIWETSTGRTVGSAMKYEGVLSNYHFSPNGNNILIASGYTVQLWQLGITKPKRFELRYPASVNHAIFANDGYKVLSVNADSTAYISEFGAEKIIKCVLKHDDVINTAIFSPDQKQILTASDDSTARIWETSTGQPFGLLMKHEAPVISAIFSSDKKKILTVSKDYTVRLWKAGTDQVEQTIKHKGEVRSACITRDGKLILTSNMLFTRDSRGSGQVHIWKSDTGVEIDSRQLMGHVQDAVFTADEKQILIRINNQWQLEDLNLNKKKSSGSEKKYNGSILVYSPDNKFVLTAGGDGNAWLQKAEDFEIIGVAMKHDAGITSAAFSPDGRYILTAGLDSTARLWETGTGHPIGSPMKHKGPVTDADFNLDGKLILTASEDSTVCFWNIDGDYDISPDLFKLQSMATTGYELNLYTKQPQDILSTDWLKLKKEYSNKAIQHFKICKYPKYNLWRHFNSDEAAKIRPELNDK